MNTDSTPSSVSTNGAGSHDGPSAIAYTDYPVHSSGEVAPNASASIPYRLRRAATIVDVIAPPSMEIVRAAFGRRRINLRDSASLHQNMHDALRAEACDAAGGAFCVITVQNKSTTPTKIEVLLRVTNEHGPEVESQTPFQMNSDGSGMGGKTSGGSRSGTTSAKARRADQPTPRSQPRAKTSSSSSNRGGNVRRPGAPGMSPKELAKKREARVRSRVAGDVITVAPIIQPSEGQKVIIIFRSYAITLDNFFTYRAEMRRQLRPAIIDAFAKAHKRVVGATAALHSGEIAIMLPEADVARLNRAFQLHQEYQLTNTEVIRDAIKKALSAPAGVIEEKLAVTSLVHVGPPGVKSEDHGENKTQEIEAMLASDLSTHDV